MNMKLLNC